MMRKHGFCFLALAGLLGAAPACILVTDDEGGDTGNDTGNATSTTGTSTTAAAESTAAETTAAASTAADDTAGAGACGWGSTGDETVPEGYVCGGDGEDPSMMFPMLCPEAVELQVGGACGGIEGPGCCDTQGNVWFCGDDGNGPALAQIEC